MGPIPSTTSLDDLTAALEPVAASTAPFVVRFRPAMRFMQSNVVVLPIDPHGPIRALHEPDSRRAICKTAEAFNATLG